MPKDTFPIDVAASVIADISAGIYRTPAGALKELISNAFDADARNVHISTNSPEFGVFTCSDDGTGFTPEKFREVMGLIGGSSKRDQGETSPVYGRPLIGRIGIGILSIGQICKSFEIYSSAKGSPKKFRARIDLEPYMRAEARRLHLGAPIQRDKTVHIGDGEIETADEDPSKHYTRVVMERIIPGFQQQLQSTPTRKSGVTPKSFKTGDMVDFLDSVRHDTVAEHGAYAQLIWELAVTSPVRYLPKGPVTITSQLSDLRKRMEKFKFSVFVDGVEIFKPILLPYSNSITAKVYPDLNLRKQITDTRTLSVRGYLYWQKTRILPRELQGILVRVRNVGIGPFDPTYLNYPRHEGWKFSQLCGELYVDNGLDEAINIDRSSFRETDESYLALQEWLFNRLGRETDEGAGIFTNIKATSDAITQRRKKREARERNKLSTEVVFGRARKAKIEAIAEPTKAGVNVTPTAIKIDSELLDQIPQRYQELYSNICVLIERSLATEVSSAKRRELLSKLAQLFSVQ